MDAKGDQYLFWKVQDEPDKVLEFDDDGVCEQVLTEWKRVRARQLARKQAERLAQTAREELKSFKDTYGTRPDVEVVQTTPFSWMTSGLVPSMSMQALPWVSRVQGEDTQGYDFEGEDMPGQEFMQTVFGLEKGGIGVAANHTKSVVYAIRLKEFNKSDTVLWDEFTADLTSDRYMSVYAKAGMDDQHQVAQAWRAELRAAAGLTWNRKADHPWPSEKGEEEAEEEDQ